MDLLRRSRGRMLLAALLVLVAVAITVPALARNASESDAPDASSADGDAGRGERFGAVRTVFAEVLAEELDLPVDRVDEALTAARERLTAEWRDERLTALEERLDDAVADGALSQEQADAILDAAEAGVLGGGRWNGFHRGPHGHGGWFGGDGGPFGDDGGPFGGAPEDMATGDRA